MSKNTFCYESKYYRFRSESLSHLIPYTNEITTTILQHHSLSDMSLKLEQNQKYGTNKSNVFVLSSIVRFFPLFHVFMRIAKVLIDLELVLFCLYESGALLLNVNRTRLRVNQFWEVLFWSVFNMLVMKAGDKALF